MCAMIRLTDIYVLMAHCCGGCVQDAFGRAELLFSVDQACIQSASHRLVTVLAARTRCKAASSMSWGLASVSMTIGLVSVTLLLIER